MVTVPADSHATRGRPRQPGTDDRILSAALAILRERGPRAVTIEAVSGVSGVAKTTIYRRYRDRDDLMATVVDEIAAHPLPGRDVTVGQKLRGVLVRVRDVFEEGLGRGGMAALLSASDPQFTAQFRRALAAHLDPLMESLTRDSEEGLLRGDVDADILLNLIFGSYLGEVLRHGEPRPGWLDRTLEVLMSGLEA
jgi:AcrR family transcriptional regulator